MTRLIHDGRRFRIEGHHGEAGFATILKLQLTSRRARWPRWIVDPPQPPPPQRVGGSTVNLTWIGQSTVLLQAAGLNILTDPFFSLRASPVQWAGPRRVRAPGLALADLPPIDLILVSHNHYDHMDLPALTSLARAHRPQIVTPLGNARHLRKAAASAPINELGWDESLAFGAARITLMPARHWSKRSFLDTNRSLWGAFVIETPAGVIYFAGDTGFGDGQIFRSIRARFGPPRLSLLPIGAYEPRWFMKPQHMNPEEAVAAHLELASRTSIAIHHATVQLTGEAVGAPAEALARALREKSVEPAAFLVPGPGRPLNIP